MNAGRGQARIRRGADSRVPDQLLIAFQLMLAVWALLCAGAVLARWLGAPLALVVSFGAATALTFATRPRSVDVATRPGVVLAGVLAGFTSYPAWAVLIVWIGLGVGLSPRSASTPDGAPPLLWIAVLLLAPVFEELLYRERLLPALRARFGAPLAIATSSLLFALPHVEAWNVLGTFCVGFLLGCVHIATGSTALCIALHAGLNGACLAFGVPPARALPSPAASAGISMALLGAGVLALRAGPSSVR